MSAPINDGVKSDPPCPLCGEPLPDDPFTEVKRYHVHGIEALLYAHIGCFEAWEGVDREIDELPLASPIREHAEGMEGMK